MILGFRHKKSYIQAAFHEVNMAQYKLHYFNARGVVESSRVMMALAGVSCEETRYPVDDQWATVGAAKAAGDLVMNMDRAPVFVELSSGFTLAQSKSIERFLAIRHGFMGSNEYESAHIDMITEHVRDIKQKYADAKAGKSGEELANVKNSWLEKDFVEWLAKLEKTIPGTSGFAVGTKLSLADITIQQLVQDYFDNKDLAAAAAAQFPKISSSVQVVATAASSYFQSRPVTAM